MTQHDVTPAATGTGPTDRHHFTRFAAVAGGGLRSGARLALMLAFTLATGLAQAAQAETIDVYGPGGPSPVMKAVAKIFTAKTGIEVAITAGHPKTWFDRAKTDADIVFAASETMMRGFITALDGHIETTSIEALYMRPSTILVRKGNPKGFAGLRDLSAPGVKVIVTEGAGPVGMWEDAVGRTGDLNQLNGFRTNIVEYGETGGKSLKYWNDHPEVDAWLIWNHWQVAHSDVADMVAVEPDLTIRRATSVALTAEGAAKPAAAEFIEFLKSAEAEAEIVKWGWSR